MHVPYKVLQDTDLINQYLRSAATDILLLLPKCGVNFCAKSIWSFSFMIEKLTNDINNKGFSRGIQWGIQLSQFYNLHLLLLESSVYHLCWFKE